MVGHPVGRYWSPATVQIAIWPCDLHLRSRPRGVPGEFEPWLLGQRISSPALPRHPEWFIDAALRSVAEPQSVSVGRHATPRHPGGRLLNDRAERAGTDMPMAVIAAGATAAWS
jgi:hypothetical protein